MSGHDRAKRASHKVFLGLPWALVKHPNFYRLSGNGMRLLICFRVQYRGSNNGNLDVTWTQMVTMGWRSKGTLYDALDELIYYGYIVRTRKGKKYGGIHYPSLYGLTWEPLHDCGKGYAGTHVPLNTWLEDRPRWKRRKRTNKS